ncbi:hypothetical protein [Trueperella sp. LYQ143]|uniref:hypothetical protein n=1 Tax=unclassified Trueperella TaxID=2630174 RepID=UPI0039838021
MTIELSSHSADSGSDPYDSPEPSGDNAQTVRTEQPATIWLGIDLSALGAADSEYLESLELPPERVNFPRLVSSVKAAQRGGMDFITLDSQFLSASETTRRDTTYDAVKVAAKLADISEGGIFAGAVDNPNVVNTSVDLLANQNGGWAGLTFGLHTNSDFAGLTKAAAGARAAGMRICVIITNPVIPPERAHIIASIADIVRLQVADPHAAREARFAIQAAGRELGRQVIVLAEMGIVISSSLATAQERAALISDMTGEELFAGIASVVGTVYSVADTIESWVGMGAADGFVFIPASLPTDLASILRGVIPLIHARSTPVAES